ncbi:hypothetical protein [Streptomyces sp. NPDC051636]|uniref:hypothetical protein n=1 Tax=Streptomyces sp. NPDC051636 TaxID=3365663 RepID=UPI003789E54F
MALPVDVQLVRQTSPAAPEQQAAPEGVTTMTPPERIQLDGRYGQNDQHVRMLVADHRRLHKP